MSVYGYIDNGKIVAPVNMRSRFKDIGGWHLLNDEQRKAYGWYPCTVINEGYDASRQIRSSMPECVYDEVNQVIIATYTIVQRPMEAIERELLDRAREHRKHYEEAGTSINGMQLRTDLGSQQRVAGLVASLLSDLELESVDFEAQPGEWVIIGRETGFAIGKAVSGHVQACFTRCKELHAAIKAAETIDDKLSIQLDTGWPGQ